MEASPDPTTPLLLKAGEGRTYRCGTMTDVFKADEQETEATYIISEWWLEPRSAGPGPHQHEENDEVFYGLEGTTSIRVGEEWVDVGPGTFLRIPARTIHDFANRTDARSGV